MAALAASAALHAQARQQPHNGCWLRLATARREYGPVVKLLSDLSDAGDALSANVLYDCPQVVRVLLSLQLDRRYGLLVADLLTPQSPSAVRIAEFHAARLGRRQRRFRRVAGGVGWSLD